jgi:hypothetical protein
VQDNIGLNRDNGMAENRLLTGRNFWVYYIVQCNLFDVSDKLAFSFLKIAEFVLGGRCNIWKEF